MNALTRRQFLARGTAAVGAAALASLLNPRAASAASGIIGLPHFAPKAKRIIWLTQGGALSQLELFDPKPGLRAMFDKDMPESIRGGQRLTGMAARQARFPIAPSVYNFEKRGRCGMELSELLPFTAQHVDDLCLIRKMHTEAINHDPAMTLLQTGHQISGRPPFGSWIAYGLGSENENLPAFTVLISRPSGGTNAHPLAERMWGSCRAANLAARCIRRACSRRTITGATITRAATACGSRARESKAAASSGRRMTSATTS